VSGGRTNLLSAGDYGQINGTKSNPVLQADLFGDFREEVIFSNGSNALRIYTSTMSATHRLVTLMHDPVYRVAVAWQNSSYNQPPHPGYYIASDMDFPPPVLNVAVVGASSSSVVPSSSSSSLAQSSSSSSIAQSSSSEQITPVLNVPSAEKNMESTRLYFDGTRVLIKKTSPNGKTKIFDLKGEER
jgi:hypothetical protein